MIGVIPAAKIRVHLLVDHLVGLAEDVPSLAVTTHDEIDVELREEQRGDLTGERALVLPVAMLPRSIRSRSSASMTVCTLRMSVNRGGRLTSTRSNTSFGSE